MSGNITGVRVSAYTALCRIAIISEQRDKRKETESANETKSQKTAEFNL